MTNKKEVAQAIWDAFYSTFADERVDFTVQKLNNTLLKISSSVVIKKSGFVIDV